MSNARLYRRLLNELSIIYTKDAPAFQYIKDQFRQYQVTSEKYCRGRKEMHHMGETYLTLLQSQRKWDEINDMYKGRGEHDIETSANLVGLRLPKTYDPSK
ncbi:protein FMC1 homolog [Gigantopelta aegis]|uniref:protein FMC1 homolog n=1 Tax=Gigantopelta aegis TaxID=1735272 RepID=UPI001B88AADF|nr:protein FMC1 homolog [Gigantopelta aegis]